MEQSVLSAEQNSTNREQLCDIRVFCVGPKGSANFTDPPKPLYLTAPTPGSCGRGRKKITLFL